MREITSATRAQTDGIEQINCALTEMDRTTQQNAALVEEVAAASSALREQADDLSRLVSAFKLAPGGAGRQDVASLSEPGQHHAGSAALGAPPSSVRRG